MLNVVRWRRRKDQSAAKRAAPPATEAAAEGGLVLGVEDGFSELTVSFIGVAGIDGMA